VRPEARIKVVIHHLRRDTVMRGQEVSREGEVRVVRIPAIVNSDSTRW
jgi:hypothetical protein